jgi:hypothetical protein
VEASTIIQLTMGTAAAWTVRIPNLSKIEAVTLLMEFWTALGFQEFKSSYNRIVLRRNGFGTMMSAFSSIITEEGTPLSSGPTELTVLIQVRPDLTIYEFQFVLGVGWNEDRAGGFSAVTEEWIDEFITFVNEWS